MIATVLFLLSIGFGISLTQWLPVIFSWLEVVVWGLVLGLFLSAWVLLIFSLLLPYRVSVGLGSICILVVISAVSTRRRTLARSNFPGPLSSGVWATITLIFSILLYVFFSTHMIQVRSDGWYSKGGSWGDLALHLNLITYFADQAKFSFQFPLLYHGALTYPFLIDFYSSLLYRFGWSIQSSLLIQGLVLAVCLVQLVMIVSLRLFKSISASIIALLIFFLGGSVAGTYYAYLDYRKSGESLLIFLQHLPQEYSQLAPQNLQFTNVITGAILPQRSMLFGLTIFCIVLTIWVVSWSNSNKKSYLILLSGGLLGLLPFAHPHTFIVGMLFLGYLTTVRFWYKYSDSKYWLYALLLAIAIALPQGLWQILATYHKGFSSWHFGWVKLPEENIVIFWLRSIGLELPFLFCLPFVIRANAERWKLYFFLPYLFLFLLVNVYIFQPYSYDNIKLLFFVHLGGSLFIGWLFSVWLRRGKCAYFITSLALLSLITTGTLSLIQQSTDTWIFLSNKDIAFAKQARAIIPPNSLVLVADQHNHPISTLAGRHILLGYRGWLWSYGVDYTSLEQDELTMFAGMSTSAQLLSKYGIDYAVIGPPERSIWGANQDFFATRYPLVLQSGDWTVYRVSK